MLTFSSPLPRPDITIFRPDFTLGKKYLLAWEMAGRSWDTSHETDIMYALEPDFPPARAIFGLIKEFSLN